MLKAAEGGVLFLDEAYRVHRREGWAVHSPTARPTARPSLPSQLHPKTGVGAAGQQILDLFMDHAENHVATSTIIIAGYEDEARRRRGGEGRDTRPDHVHLPCPHPRTAAGPRRHVAQRRLRVALPRAGLVHLRGLQRGAGTAARGRRQALEEAGRLGRRGAGAARARGSSLGRTQAALEARWTGAGDDDNDDEEEGVQAP